MFGKERKLYNMSTKIRPELSEKNKYWIEKHRYYELKHFCLQYPIWKKAYNALDGFAKSSSLSDIFSQNFNASNPTAKCVEAKLVYSDKMQLVEKAAKETSLELNTYILKAVTEGVSYDIMLIRDNIPCCRDTYYEFYRRFFWLLNKTRK